MSEEYKPKSLSKSFNDSLNVSNDGKINKNYRKKSISNGSGNTSSSLEKKDNMNEKIQELLNLIPDDYFHENKDRSSGTKDGKPNKGQILTKTVEYLQDVQNKIDDNNRKEVELIWKLKKLYQRSNSFDKVDLNLNNTSAEMVLAEIGVGPLANMIQKEKTPNNNFEYGGYDQYS